MTQRLFLLYSLPFADGEIKQQLLPKSTHLTLMKNLSDGFLFLKKLYLDYGVIHMLDNIALFKTASVFCFDGDFKRFYRLQGLNLSIPCKDIIN